MTAELVFSECFPIFHKNHVLHYNWKLYKIRFLKGIHQMSPEKSVYYIFVCLFRLNEL